MERINMYYGYCYNDAGDILPVKEIKEINEVLDFLYKQKTVYSKVIVTDDNQRNFAESENGWVIYPMRYALQDIRDHILISPFSINEFKVGLLRLNIVMSNFDELVTIEDAKFLIDAMEQLYEDLV